jgi:hypothetical protein
VWPVALYLYPSQLSLFLNEENIPQKILRVKIRASVGTQWQRLRSYCHYYWWLTAWTFESDFSSSNLSFITFCVILVSTS